MPIKFLHTSDIHLGAKFAFLGGMASNYREELKKTFSNIIYLAIEEDVDFVLISGDLFDNPYPSELLKDFVRSEIQRLPSANTKVAIIAGNHDLFEAGSVWSSGFLSDLPNVKVFFPDQTDWYISELDITIHGVSNNLKKSTVSPLSKIKKSESKYNIALVHGSYIIEGKIKDSNFPITDEDIESSRMDYIALGDWHGLADYSSENVKCAYPGSPEPLNINQQKSGFVILGIIEDNSVTVKRSRVGRYSYKSINLDDEQVGDTSSAIKLLGKVSDKQVILNLASSSVDMEDVEFQTWLNSKFYYVNFKFNPIEEDNINSLDVYKDNEIVKEFLSQLDDLAKQKDKYTKLKSRSILELLRRIDANK